MIGKIVAVGREVRYMRFQQPSVLVPTGVLSQYVLKQYCSPIVISIPAPHTSIPVFDFVLIRVLAVACKVTFRLGGKFVCVSGQTYPDLQPLFDL